MCLMLLGMITSIHLVQAQEHVVSGTVVSEADDEPLAGASVVETGTLNGTATDSDGNFVLDVSSPDASLTVTFIGYLSLTVAIEGQSSLTISLEEDTGLLEEVVVTAGGIQRKERALGYSVTEVGGEDFREVRENNFANALTGKVAGVVVTKPATGPAGSSRVIIRGASSLGEDSQPLYVVDGVPIDNTTLGSAGMWGGTDGGDGIGSMNPDDIDKISVLKGPSAAALYGTRAKNGVILITTKKATPGLGLGIEFSSNTTFENVLVNTDWQTEYGQGLEGARPDGEAKALTTADASWGEAFDGVSTISWDGSMQPYALAPDAVTSFYNTGVTSSNSLALTTANEVSTLRLGLSHLTNEGVSPNSGLQRTSFSLRGTSKFGSSLTADAKINLIREFVINRPRLSDSPGNANYSVFQLAGNINVLSMRCPYVPDDPLLSDPFSDNCTEYGQDTDGTELHGRDGSQLFDNSFQQNPYWAAHQYKNSDEDLRAIGFVSLGYEFAQGIQLRGRFGGDTYTTRRTGLTPWGTEYQKLGSQSETEYRITEINTDFLLTIDRDLNSLVGIQATLGGNLLYQERETLTLSGGGGYSVPGLEVVTNQNTRSHNYGFNEKQINSLYGSAEISYDEWLYLTMTARNDWSSTLPAENNSYFYPSIGVSIVLTDALNLPEVLSFAKIRGSWAQVGGDTNPYQLALTYSLSGSHLGQPRGNIAQGSIPLANLKPSQTTGIEFGIDFRFVDNRFGIDATYYSEVATDQILSTTISAASGFGRQVINAGEISNKGFEVLLSTTPVRSGDWRWNLDVNLAKNQNEVVELVEGQTSLVLGEARHRGNFVTADVGEPYGSIKGRKYLRQNVPSGDGASDCDATGPIVHDDMGLPVATKDLCVLGNGSPDFSGGIRSGLRWRNISFNMLFDLRFGGDLFSVTNSAGYSNGLHKATLSGRKDGYVGEGVNEDGQPNTVSVHPQQYFQRIGGGTIGEQFIYDASFVKLREVQISYNLPSRLFARTPIKFASLSLVARNLWLIHSNVDNIDPESVYNSTNRGIGLEHSGVPQTRSIGFNVNVRM